MLIQTFFKSLTSTSTRRRPIRRRPPASRPCLETLEDRCLPSFLPAVSYPVGVNPHAVVTGDFNGDGKLDMAVANYSSNTVSILLGKGDGTFQPAQNFATGPDQVALAVGDFNGDGKLDLVTTTHNAISVLLGNGDGTFQAPRSLVLQEQWPPGYTGPAYLPQAPSSIAVGDLNGDGKLDLVVRGQTTFTVPSSYSPYETYYYDSYVNVLLGNGDGSFTPKSAYHLDNASLPALALGDFNGDGKLDVATPVNTSEVAVTLGTGAGTLGSPSSFAVGNSPSSVAAGDVNGDGKLDLVTANSGQTDVSVLLGNGDGTFQAASNFLAGSHPNSLAMADFNRDGKIDLVTANGGGVSVLLGNGTFQAPRTFAAGAAPSSVAVGDFNGDGFPDLVVVNSGSNTVSVLLNTGDWRTLGVSGFPSPVTAGTTGNFSVTAKNADGTTDTKYTGTVHFTSTDPQAVLPVNYTFTAADAGVYTFSATLKTAGTQSITVTDTTTATLAGSETGITVNPAAASKFIITAPSSVTAGVPFSLTVTVEDAYGNVVTGYTGKIHFSSTDKTATLPANYTFTAADKGVHTFTGLILRKKGNQTIVITDKLNSSLTGSVIENVL
jgi:hypothetical protein